MGVTESHLDIYDSELGKGRFFSSREIDYGTNVALIGHKVKTTLFPYEEPIGKKVVIRGLKYTVIGLMEETG